MYRIYQDEIWEKVCGESKELLEDYLLEMKSQKKSIGTITQYESDIKRCLCWMYTNAKNKSILEIKKKIFRRYWLDLMDNGCSGARLVRQQSSIRTMLTYAVDNDEDYEDYEANPMASIKGVPKEPVRDIIFLSDETIDKLIDKLIEKKAYRIAMFVSLAYDSGARRGELSQVDRSSFEGEGNQTNIVIGKRAKRFKLRFFSRTKEIYDKYIREEGVTSGPLFFKMEKGERVALDKVAYYGWIVRCRKMVEEIDGEYLAFGPHSFRHSTAQNLFEGTHYALKHLGKEKLSVDEIRLLLNHADAGTTQGYLKNQDEALENELFSM